MIKTMNEFFQHTSATTISEFMAKLYRVQDIMHNTMEMSVGIQAGHDLFMTLVNRSADEDTDLSLVSFKKQVQQRIVPIMERVRLCKHLAARTGAKFVQDDTVILLPAPCETALHLLDYAANIEQKRFKVFVTEQAPSDAGRQAAHFLQSKRIQHRIIGDAVVGYIMDKVDMVVAGCHGVVENGGIINNIGTYQAAVVAQALNKPFYVVAESFKFIRMDPLDQYDISDRRGLPEIVRFRSSTWGDALASHADLEASNPTVDYTPPTYITLLFTDLGVLTPSGVSDELIKLTL
ncbi:hypothetical protein BC940DRAFT_295316 [Gongronella butleri]|nr:hypothetical protein BC940DRAFT_295316 [Gongronella butleri]